MWRDQSDKHDSDITSMFIYDHRSGMFIRTLECDIVWSRILGFLLFAYIQILHEQMKINY